MSQQFRTPRDNAQPVVEVLFPPPRPPSPRLHFLRLPQLILDLFLTSDIAGNGGSPHHLPLRIVDGRNRNRDVQVPPVLGDSYRLKVFDSLSAANLFQDRGNLVCPLWRS